VPITRSLFLCAYLFQFPTFSNSSNSNGKLLAAFIAYLKVEKGLRLFLSAPTGATRAVCEFLEGRKRVLLAARREDCGSSCSSSLAISGWPSVARKALGAAAFLSLPLCWMIFSNATRR